MYIYIYSDFIIARVCSKHKLTSQKTENVHFQEGPQDDENDKGPTHFQNSATAIERNQDMWEARLENSGAEVPTFIEPEALDEVLAAARASQRREHVHASSQKDEHTSPTLHEATCWRYEERCAALAPEEEEPGRQRGQASAEQGAVQSCREHCEACLRRVRARSLWEERLRRATALASARWSRHRKITRDQTDQGVVLRSAALEYGRRVSGGRLASCDG